jgi:hypothetical protein
MSSRVTYVIVMTSCQPHRQRPSDDHIEPGHRPLRRLHEGLNEMKRLAVVIAGVLCASAWAATAQASTPAQYPVSGTYEGTGSIDSPGTCGGALIQTFGTATGDITPFGASTLSYDFCVPFAEPGSGGISPVTSGNVVITAADGSISGTLSGTVQTAETTSFPYDFEVTVTGGTGVFSGATGSIGLVGNFSGGAATITGTASGTVSYGPEVATIKSDCAQNGWQNVVDANGQPFKNQGLCVASVRR